ncbi:uncharacterized protein M6G45_012212 isoform 1-T1 [Spheniscus humboldti]
MDSPHFTRLCFLLLTVAASRPTRKYFLKEFMPSSGRKPWEWETRGILNSGGNPQFSISKKSSIGIIIPVLILGVCAAALAMYCVQRNQNGQETVMLQESIELGMQLCCHMAKYHICHTCWGFVDETQGLWICLRWIPVSCSGISGPVIVLHQIFHVNGEK